MNEIENNYKMNEKKFKKLCSVMDHTNLSPSLYSNDIVKLSQEAIKYKFASIVLNPYYVPLANEILNLDNSDYIPKITTVVGFPLGQNTSEIKRLEAREAIYNGASELDMVINISALKDGDFSVLENEINDLVALDEKVVTKIIIETGLLTNEEKRDVCLIAKKAGADFIKTSTGINSTGARIEDLKLIKSFVPSMKIKASGGIKNLKTAISMIENGADRIGTSSAVPIALEALNLL